MANSSRLVYLQDFLVEDPPFAAPCDQLVIWEEASVATKFDPSEDAWVRANSSSTSYINIIKSTDTGKQQRYFSASVGFKKGEGTYEELRILGVEGSLLGSLDISGFEAGVWHTETVQLVWATDTEKIQYVAAKLPTNSDPFYLWVCPLCGEDPIQDSDPAQPQILDNFVAENCTYLGDHTPVLGNKWEIQKGEATCKWVGAPGYNTGWEANNSAWNYDIQGGETVAETPFIAPVSVNEVEWWKAPRPDSLTLRFKINSNGTPPVSGIVALCGELDPSDAFQPKVRWTEGQSNGQAAPAFAADENTTSWFSAKQLFASDAHVTADFRFNSPPDAGAPDGEAVVLLRAPRDTEFTSYPGLALSTFWAGGGVEALNFGITDAGNAIASETFSPVASYPISVHVEATLSGTFFYWSVTFSQPGEEDTTFSGEDFAITSEAGVDGAGDYIGFAIGGQGYVDIGIIAFNAGVPVCTGKTWDKADGTNEEITWGTSWDGSSKARITFLAKRYQPYRVTIQGSATAGESLADIYVTDYPGSWVKAYDTDGILIATAESTAYQQVDLYPEYVSAADVDYIEFYTTATPAEQVGFGFQSVTSHCAIPVWVSLPSPLRQDDIQVTAGLPRGVMVELPAPPIGAISAFARMLLTTLDVSLPSPIGEILLTARLIPATQVALPSPIGAINILIEVEGDAWTELWPDSCGFSAPRPRLSGYTYSRDAGLQRTKMLSGATRQRRRWTDGRRKAQISVEVPTGALYVFEEFIANFGYNWFLMPLVTGDNGGPTAELHSVRVIADPTFGEVVGETIVATLDIELQDRVT